MNKVILSVSAIVAFILFMAAPAGMSFAADEAAPSSGDKKILVAYFSLTGNTREVAGQIHKLVGGDIFEIRSIKPYPTEYNVVVKVAKKEISDGYKPELLTKVDNIGSYDVIYIGYPVWWGTFPPPVKTFLSKYDLSGKTVVPFCTHGGGGPGHSFADVSELCPRSTVLDSFETLGNRAKDAQGEVSEWLREIGRI
ncbi:MAG: flavodoxin [Candidatus Omnitrophota bacterium]|nr:flavodoxin [Candidatus Omnitrophota bacterium]